MFLIEDYPEKSSILKAKNIKHITITKRKSLCSPDDNKKQLK